MFRKFTLFTECRKDSLFEFSNKVKVRPKNHFQPPSWPSGAILSQNEKNFFHNFIPFSTQPQFKREIEKIFITTKVTAH
jgi:hypothetical protein